MKKLNTFSEDYFLKLFFAVFSGAFLIAAMFMPDRNTLLAGFWNILTQPCKISTNYFALGGYAATYFNMGIVGLLCTALCWIPGAKANNGTTLAVLLTVGFASWGMNPVNMLPTVLGVALFCAVKKQPLGSQINAMMFSTGIAPLISDLLLRYPGTEYLGFNWAGLALGMGVGLVIGFFLPAGLAHSPAVHKGYDHYSAALPIGVTAFFLRAVLYTVAGGALPDAPRYETPVASWLNTNLFCIILFLGCIVAAAFMGCGFKDYWKLMKDSGHSVSFSTRYGNAPFLMNVGVFGLFILAYFNLTGGAWTGMTFGIVFCMLATSNSGSHPRNVWPVMAGYFLMSTLFRFLFQGEGDFALTVGNQTIMIGLCYANGLSPISGKYGWWAGLLAGGLHYLLVTAVPLLHGGFCLYNGGFTAALICLIFVPQLEKFCKTKEARV